MSDSSYTLRAIGDDDLPFLREVYAATRREELELTEWSDEQKEQFIDMQFNAQHHHYQQHYLGAQFSVIEVEGQSVGRLYRHDQPHDIRIVDIAILPAYRNRGTGSRILNDILLEAEQKGAPVTIHVEVNNPAMSLYQRLGFEPLKGDGIYLLMEKKPGNNK